MKQFCKYLRGMRYKIRMTEIPCDESTYIYGDKKSVLCNNSIPYSNLNNNPQSIAYHLVREGVARD